MIEIGYAGFPELAWLEQRLGLTLTRNAKGLAAWHKGTVVGVVAYDLWTANSVHAHICVDEPIAWRRLLPVVFRAPFETRGVLIGVIRASNAASRKLTEHFGFKQTHSIRDGAAVGEDLIVYELRKEDCRYG